MIVGAGERTLLERPVDAHVRTPQYPGSRPV